MKSNALMAAALAVCLSGRQLDAYVRNIREKSFSCRRSENTRDRRSRDIHKLPTFDEGRPRDRNGRLLRMAPLLKLSEIRNGFSFFGRALSPHLQR